MAASMAGAMAGENLDRWLEWLGDLATYRPSDFLMFSARTYWRLFELHNAAWWPLPWLLPAVGVAALAWCWRGSVAAHRACAVGLAAAAAFVGWAFVLQRYAAINWAATWLALLWFVPCLTLLALAASGQLRATASRVRRRLACVLVLWALLGQPLLAPLAGRPIAQAEVFGLAPDPTALAVLAWLLATEAGGAGWLRWASRLAWAAVLGLSLASAATLAVLGEWQAVVPTAAALAGIAAAHGSPRGASLRPSQRGRSGKGRR